MIRYSSAVTIGRPPGEVFPYVVEFEKQGQWIDVPMERLTEGPLRNGSRLVVTFGRPPLRASITLEVTALVPNERLAFATVSTGPVHWEGEYRLEPAGADATRMSQQGTLRFSGLWRLVEPMVGAEMRRNEIAELERLKAVLEVPDQAGP